MAGFYCCKDNFVDNEIKFRTHFNLHFNKNADRKIGKYQCPLNYCRTLLNNKYSIRTHFIQCHQDEAPFLLKNQKLAIEAARKLKEEEDIYLYDRYGNSKEPNLIENRKSQLSSSTIQSKKSFSFQPNCHIDQRDQFKSVHQNSSKTLKHEPFMQLDKNTNLKETDLKPTIIKPTDLKPTNLIKNSPVINNLSSKSMKSTIAADLEELFLKAKIETNESDETIIELFQILNEYFKAEFLNKQLNLDTFDNVEKIIKRLTDFEDEKTN